MKSAFTLIELTVVLAIVAIFAHLAVRELGKLQEAKLSAAADRQLEEIRRAVYEDVPGGDPTGFLADTGRLPMPIGTATNGWSLSELLSKPDGMARFSLLAATNGNFVSGVSADLAENGVFVPTGWRGPYLRLPLGRDEIFDPWGNAFTAVDDAGLERLTASNGVFVAACHYGASGQPRDKRAISLIPDGGATSRLVVSIVSTSGATGVAKCKWFGPSAGLITGAVENVSYPGMVRFESLTPGIRVFHDSVSRAPRFIRIRPGDNVLQITLP